MHYLTKPIAMILLASSCLAQGKGKGDSLPSTNSIQVKIEKTKETKLEHSESRLILKERDKGSKKESDWKTSKEYPLMFKNNKKAKKVK